MMPIPSRRLVLAAALGAALAACGGNKPANDSRSASGEVLEGSISDAMIPLDKLTSQPPLAPAEGGSHASAGDDATDAADEASGAASEAASSAAEASE